MKENKKCNVGIHGELTNSFGICGSSNNMFSLVHSGKLYDYNENNQSNKVLKIVKKQKHNYRTHIIRILSISFLLIGIICIPLLFEKYDIIKNPIIATFIGTIVALIFIYTYTKTLKL